MIIKYDLIYCVNVFEHLNDWRKFLLVATEWLSKDGKIVILCPNYGFPYESHFRIPIFMNKAFTYKIFNSFIVLQNSILLQFLQKVFDSSLGRRNTPKLSVTEIQ